MNSRVLYPYVNSGGYVYLMALTHNGDTVYKIGVSREPDRRRYELERVWGCEVRVLAARWCEHPFATERRLHSAVGHDPIRARRLSGRDGYTEMCHMEENDVRELVAALTCEPMAKAKSRDENFQKVTTYLRRDTYLKVKRKLLDQGGGQISDLVQGLLEAWSNDSRGHS